MISAVHSTGRFLQYYYTQNLSQQCPNMANISAVFRFFVPTVSQNVSPVSDFIPICTSLYQLVPVVLNLFSKVVADRLPQYLYHIKVFLGFHLRGLRFFFQGFQQVSTLMFKHFKLVIYQFLPTFWIDRLGDICVQIYRYAFFTSSSYALVLIAMMEKVL